LKNIDFILPLNRRYAQRLSNTRETSDFSKI
jgi:hypothetical protein